MESDKDKNNLIQALLKKRKRVDFEKVDKKVKKVFGKEIDQWKIITSQSELILEKGYHVKYIDNKFKKSTTALMAGIIKSKEGNIYKLIMKNVYSANVWTINPSCYYFYKKVSSNKSHMRQWLEEILGQEQIKKMEKEIELDLETK